MFEKLKPYVNKGKLSLSVILGLAIIFVFSFFTGFSYLCYTFMYLISYLVLSVSWYILYTYSGQLSLGHALPFGIGAFSLMIFLSKFNFPPIVALILAPILAAVIGGTVGLTTIRLRPAYQGIAILIASQVAFWISLLQVGEEGISIGTQILAVGQVYAIVFVIFLICTLTIFFVENSRIGIKLKAIKEDGLASESLGINVTYFKVLIFFVSSFFAGLGGTCFALYTSHADYTIFSIPNSFLPIAMVVVGGSNELAGCILGSVIISILMRYLPIKIGLPWTYIIYGVLVILVLKIYPAGMLGAIKKALGKQRMGG
ncbi:MAG: branched-chain amino acid ABC transporter permease [Candidatus Hadarchaeum sp.]|uniref:branched-chain amino acid ABC transporter permease n=1 Tax=Candidatus Hadarchaeum sp. TaxID=2883567 RepID=UPI003179F1D9